jgi:hypothetical protein
MSSPCQWPVSYAGCSSCAPFVTMSVEDKAAFEEMATDWLYAWTLSAFGVCHTTIRPCRPDDMPPTFWGSGPLSAGSSGGWFAYPNPRLVGGAWTNLRCGRCLDGCSCTAPTTLRLPGPVISISEVIVDGDLLPSSSYRVDDASLLVRVDGGHWPTAQNLAQPTSEAGTWSVSYDLGREVPIGGQVAAGVLACELAKAACRDATCALPQRLQSISRQGVTVAVLDDFQDVTQGRTGIWLIDSWVSSVTKPTRASKVYSPDVKRTRRMSAS